MLPTSSIIISLASSISPSLHPTRHSRHLQARMSKHVSGALLSLIATCFLLFQFRPALSQLSPNQTTIMTTLASLVSNDSSWNIKKQPNPCLWRGVTCGPPPRNSSVTGLSLSGFGLSSSEFLATVCKIGSLQSLDLSNNYFVGIPAGFFAGCGWVDGLKVLNFSRNKLAGQLPAFAPGFYQLESLDVSFNSLSGNLTSQLDGLVSLRCLNLSFNSLLGSIPTPKSLMLEELQLSDNAFQGTIPPEFGNYAHLVMLDVSTNNLQGSIPSTIGNLTMLQVLLLSANNLNGEIPSILSDIQTLYRFAANQNQFVGLIPSGLTRHLSFLDLSYNKLTGPIPTDFFSQKKLLSVDLSYNFLEGQIPENMSASLFRLRLGSNRLRGSIPSSVSGLYNLTYLELDNNSLSNEIPAGLGSCRSLLLLNLAQNQLTGSLSVAFGNLSKLQVLELQSNKLGGQIPSEITRLAQLSTLNVSSNSLDGMIPSSISNLENLVRLNLQDNKLNGTIPVSISGMKFLLELQLAQNQLGGIIPSMPVNLQIALNLSGNHLEGTIPDTLSDLTELEILDLSENDLSGEIPDSLTQLSSLTHLILSNNHLTGVIPKFRPWVSFIANGNPGLVNATQATTSRRSGKKSVATAVLLAVGAAGLFVAVAMITVWLCSRRVLKVNDQQSQSGEELTLPQVIGGNLLTMNVIHRSNIDFAAAMEAVTDPMHIELKTRFSTYYKATMPCGTSYFVKKLNWSDKIFQWGSHDRFGQELEVIGRLRSSNVMIPLAYVQTVDSAYLFYEYAHKGTLFDVLHGKLGATDWSSRYSIAVGVAQGLAFLHGCSSGPILLFDLSSRNILLKSLKEPLIGDIELCKVIDPTKSTGSLSTVAGSVGYIPPEYAYTMRVTMAGNVYSFGVVLLELVTGKPAVSEGTELAKWVLSNSMRQDKWDQILDRSISRVSQTTRSQMLAVLKVALSCVDPSPQGRPKMKSVLKMILDA